VARTITRCKAQGAQTSGLPPRQNRNRSTPNARLLRYAAERRDRLDRNRGCLWELDTCGSLRLPWGEQGTDSPTFSENVRHPATHLPWHHASRARRGKHQYGAIISTLPGFLLHQNQVSFAHLRFGTRYSARDSSHRACGPSLQLCKERTASADSSALQWYLHGNCLADGGDAVTLCASLRLRALLYALLPPALRSLDHVLCFDL